MGENEISSEVMESYMSSLADNVVNFRSLVNGYEIPIDNVDEN